MEFDLIIVRKDVLPDMYGAYLWKKYKGGDVIIAENNTQFDMIEDKRILIIGRYYDAKMDQILYSANRVTVFCNNSDLEPPPSYQYIQSGECTGFAHWVVQELAITDPTEKRIAEYLDEYMYGEPSEKAIHFQNGLRTIEASTDYSRLMTIEDEDDINRLIENGEKIQRIDLRFAKQQLRSSVSYRLGDNWAQIGIGDIPTITSCLLFANKSKSGLALFFRYDLTFNKTFITVRVTKASGLDAGIIARNMVKGGDFKIMKSGSKFLSGGSINGLHFPDDILK